MASKKAKSNKSKKMLNSSSKSLLKIQAARVKLPPYVRFRTVNPVKSK